MATEKYLRHIYLFEPFTDVMIKSLAEKTKFMQCNSGQVLIEQGKMNQSLWLLIKGSAKVWEIDGARKAEIFTLKPGDIFGELSFADTLPASATVIAADDSIVLRIKFQDLEDVLQKQPLIKAMMLRKMIRIISQRLRRANEVLRAQHKMEKSSPVSAKETSNTFKSIEVSFGGLKATGGLPEGVNPNSGITKEASGKHFDSVDPNEKLFDMDELEGIKKLEPFSQD